MSSGFHAQKPVCHPRCANLLSEYSAFIRDSRGLAPSTVSIRQQYVSVFLFDGLNHRCTVSEIEDLHPSIVHDHVIARGKSLSRAGGKQLVSSLRSFLRFLHIKGYTKRDLISAVPSIPIAKLDRLPRGISWEEVHKVLAAVDRDRIAAEFGGGARPRRSRAPPNCRICEPGGLRTKRAKTLARI
ncbi:MAG: hypothetical protein ACREBC_15710 [Pyrinomonadaceae bacterium]